jgi:multidrug efflux pump subunit AcrB
MNIPRFALTHRPIVLAFTAVLIAIGVANFLTMSRREDPEITIRDALILTPWPGASAERVEELITEPLEDLIVEIPEIATVESKSMPGFSVIQVAAADRVTEVEQVWDDLRAKVEAVRTLPPGVQQPWVNADFGDVYEITFALHQTEFGDSATAHRYSPRELEIFAERIEDEIELLPSVARVEFWGNQEERIYVELDSADFAKIDLTAVELKALFQARNIVFPGGELDTENARYSMEPTGEFTSLQDIEKLVVGRVDRRAPVQLRNLPVNITRRYEEPARALTRLTTPEAPHVPAIAIGISMKSGNNIAQMETPSLALSNDFEPAQFPPTWR